MATALDVDYLSAYLSLPQQSLVSIVDAPTSELVRSVLDAVLTRAKEHDELTADKIRVDIELENAVRSSETRIEGLRSNLENTQKTVEEVRIKLKEEETARSSLESKIQTLKSSSATSSADVEALRTRIATLESGNRDTLAVLESKATANDNLSVELQAQHAKGLELSQQVTTLQQTIQNAESAASSAKFREQSLKQEKELAQRNNEWLENDLKAKTAEALKYRKEKGAKIVELTRLNEDLNSNIEASKRIEQALRTRLDEMQKKTEESLSKVQQLQGAAAQAEEGFRQELESARRLAELQSQQTETHRKRLREVEASLEKAKDDAAEEVGRARQETEVERQGRGQEERRVAELEAEVDRLEALVASHASQAQVGSIPGTPRRGLNGSSLGRSGSPAQFGTPGPFGTPGSVRKSVVTATQALDELYKVKGQLKTEQRKTQRLEAELDDFIQSAEAKQPELEEMQAEHERLQQEVVQMSEFVEEANKARDRAKKEARKSEGDASTSRAEARILQQQLRDLSAQVKILLFEVDARERGLDAIGTVERVRFESIARGEADADENDGMTDTGRFISERLVTFRNIAELQKTNAELLRLTRDLGDTMESDEALAAKSQAAKDRKEVKTLEGRIETYKDELQATIIRCESYVKERDMFRRMAQHRGQLPAQSDLASVFGQSVDGNGVIPTIEQPANANSIVMLRELQTHFDQYREEQSIDRRTLKEQAEKMSAEKSSLQGEVSKITSQLTLATERYEMLRSNYTMVQNENTELQKRSQVLSEAAAKQDIRTQQVAEELVEANGMIESMRNETANLKAEKKLWKEIQDRLGQENENLTNDRSRLNNLVANQQTLQNERELSHSEALRKLNSEIETLKAELTTTKRKLDIEVEDGKKAQLRKDLSQVREELIAAKTTRDHLQSRVDELAIELKSAEERVQLLQPRPTARAGRNGDSSAEAAGCSESSLSKEQELAIEVSELTRNLELLKSELEGAKSQMEQYKSISQASEEELQSMNETQDQYREEMDRIIEEKDAKIRELQQRADDISAELSTSNNELTKLRNEQSKVAHRAEEAKAILEVEISRLKDEFEQSGTAAQFHQQDLRAQAAIATKAQQDYENELVKHAEAAKSLQSLRTEYNQLKTEVATFRAEAESARVTLGQNEGSWEERRAQFEQELKESRTRRDDADAQNKLLHQQLEQVGAQVAELQQNRAYVVDATGSTTTGIQSFSDRTSEGLRELNIFLRREKEIVEVQYDLKTQEAKRLQQQLDYLQSQLDESRLKLDQERRLHADGNRSSTTQKELMEKLNELNLFRESSITLRNENRQAQVQLTEKSKRVEELTEQIQPLEARIRELEHEKETAAGEVRLLQEDRDRWQKRTQDIISKHDRIDPAEMEELKGAIESLRAERDTLLEEKQPLQEQIQTLEGEKVAWQASRLKLIDQSKEKARVQRKEIQDRTAERDIAIGEKETLQQQLSPLQKQLETANAEKTAAEQRVFTLDQLIESLRMERDQALQDATQATPRQISTEPVIQASSEVLDQQITDLRQQLDIVKKEKESLEAQLTDLRTQLETSNGQRDAAIASASEAQAHQPAQVSATQTETTHEEGQIDETQKIEFSDDERMALEERIAAAEAKATDADKKAANLEEQMETTIKNRSDKMKATLNKRLVDARETQKAELEEEYKLKLEHEKEKILAELNARSVSSDSSLGLTIPSKTCEEAAAPAFAFAPTPSQKADAIFDLHSITDAQCREFLSNNATAKAIFINNLKKRLENETQKLKEEHENTLAQKLAEFTQEQEKLLTEAQQKAEASQITAVSMSEKKTALKMNMAENRAKQAQARFAVVETAAKETPQKPVVEVYEVAKLAKPAPAPPAPGMSFSTIHILLLDLTLYIAPATQAPSGPVNGTTMPAPQSTEKKPESTETLAAAMETSIINGSSNLASGIPSAPSNNGARSASSSGGSMIPQMRGGLNQRGGRGGGIYQAGPNRGAPSGIGRGRGGSGQQRGGVAMNPNAPQFSPQGQKRGRDEGSVSGPGPKRPRGGGQ
ncbi:hypothetical protein BJ878DRAFT_411571 [Calycina marina]|uniref:Nucleoprotein TPR/MLP1 domain-containing protein n=1 Tax=Calycina marina TaxID=1763456 RepID=A0A9P7ZBP7_9HELO|nr:hypothetical protein BJ878DRAFT_411571 [Calycina marina]